MPNPDYPSLTRIGVQKVEFVDVHSWGLNYKKCLVKITQCKEDRQKADFDKFVEKFAASNENEIYVKYPYQIEACVVSFEDNKNMFKLHTNPDTGELTLKKYKQDKNNVEYR